MAVSETDPHLQLAASSALVQALLDSASGPPNTSSERRRREVAARTLFDQHPTAAAVLGESADAPARFNARWRELFGCDTPLHERVQQLCDSVIASGASVHVARLALVIHGRERFLAMNVTPIAGAQGLIAIAREITDDVIASRLALPPGALVWGGASAGRTDYFNARWREAGCPADWRCAVHPDDLSRVIDAFGEAARRRRSTTIEARLRVDGHDRWHRVAFVNSPETGWFGTAVDSHDANVEAERSELLAHARAARADAEHANRLKDEFLAAVSHELRAPVTTMLLWEKVLRDESNNATARMQALDAIHHSALAQSRLVGDLLDVSRAISGKLFVDLRCIALAKLVSDALESARPAALTKGIELRCHSLPFHEEINGDATRLGQALDNLLSNAIKFSEPGGSVTLAARRDGERIVIVVEDTGRGIAPEFLMRVFEPFSQCDDALTRREGGLGLGLAISRKIVELHGGTLTADSAGRGLGTTLTLTLPAIAPRPERAAPSGAGHVLTLRGIKVLVIDDDTRVRDALALLLGRTGAAVHTVSSAAQARTSIATDAPDVIMCDIAMHDEDGYAFITKLRQSDNDTPAIAVTAFASEADACRAIAAGFDMHVAKPIHIERMITSISVLHAGRTLVDD